MSEPVVETTKLLDAKALLMRNSKVAGKTGNLYYEVNIPEPVELANGCLFSTVGTVEARWDSPEGTFKLDDFIVEFRRKGKRGTKIIVTSPTGKKHVWKGIYDYKNESLILAGTSLPENLVGTVKNILLWNRMQGGRRPKRFWETPYI